MNPSKSSLQDQVLTQVMRLNAGLHGVVAGLLSGGLLFLATMWLVIKGGDQVGPHLGLLGQFFPGYEVTPMGALIGLVYGFVFGFITIYPTVRLYNALVDRMQGARRENSKG
ncbi:MAG: hypothetical protein ACPG4N_01900 [Gammaproteobacteria bacterium]